MRLILSLPIFLFIVSSSTSFGQVSCDTDTMPCYFIIAHEVGLLPQSDHQQPFSPELWTVYVTKLKEVYTKEVNEINVEFGNEKQKAHSEGFILLKEDRQFTIAERKTWNWGGVFYFMDFKAIAKDSFYEKLGAEKLKISPEQ